MGLSDGASYSLSIGMAYPDLFRTIVAFSPGYAFAPTRLDTKQRIFIAHSRRDPILPAENTREMVKGLKAPASTRMSAGSTAATKSIPTLKNVRLRLRAEAVAARVEVRPRPR